MTMTEANIEIWKPIFGFDGYMVSNFGRVKSLKNGKERILKPWETCGYLQVLLSQGKKTYHKLVHRLVAEAFVPNDDIFKVEVNHKDENTFNNLVENLEWCDRTYNNNYGTRNERVSKIQSMVVLQYSLDGTLIREWKSASEAARQLGFSSGGISNCCLNKPHRNTYKKFKWQYKYEN